MKQEALDHTDPRSPFVYDLRELGRRPGSMTRVTRTVAAPSELGLDVVSVPEGSDLELRMRFESVMEGVLLTGTLHAKAEAECARCLDAFGFAVEADVQELFVYPESDAEDDEVSRISGGRIDFEPLVRDAVVLALPANPLCRDDCPGLCNACGARLADDPGHRHEVGDPRWEALRDLPVRTEPNDTSTPTQER
jgi:uncharacterized protein